MHLEHDANGGPDELRLVLDCDGDPLAGGLVSLPLLLGSGGIAGALDRLHQSAQEQSRRLGLPAPPAVDAAQTAAPIVSLVLYICSQAAEIAGKHGVPGNPQPVRTRRDGWRLFPADGLRVWDVGVRIGAALRRAYQAEQLGAGGEHAGPRPHVRRAHWHGFRSGPRKRPDGSEIPAHERRFDLRWLPPIAVNLDDPGDLPAVVRRVS